LKEIIQDQKKSNFSMQTNDTQKLLASLHFSLFRFFAKLQPFYAKPKKKTEFNNAIR